MEKPNVLKNVQHYQRSIENSQDNEERLLHCIKKLLQLPIKVEHLQETGVGKTVNSLRKFEGKIGNAAKELVSRWKAMVVAEKEDSPSSNNTQYQNGSNYDNENDDDDDNDGMNQQTTTHDKLNNHHCDSSPREMRKEKSHKNVYKKESYNDERKHAEQKQNKEGHSSSSNSYKEKHHNQNEHKSSKNKHKRSSSSKHKSSSRHHKKYVESDENPNSEEENYKSQEKENSCDREREQNEERVMHRSRREKEDKYKEFTEDRGKVGHDEKYKKYRKEKLEEQVPKQHEKYSRDKNDQETEEKPSTASLSSEHNHESKNYSKRKYEQCSDEESLDNHKSKTSSHKKKKEDKHKSSKHKEDTHSKKEKHDKTKERSDDKKNKYKKSSSNSNNNALKRPSDSDEPQSKKVKDPKVEPQAETAEVDNDGIDSSMGANFADVLGMLNVPVKKSKKLNNSKSNTSPQKTKDINKHHNINSGNTTNDIKSSPSKGPSTSGYSRNSKPDLLSSTAKLEPLDPSIALELPIISNNYKPLPVNPTVMDCVYSSTVSTSSASKSQTRTMTDSEALTHSISSKTMRTKIYSGVKTGQILQVPSLFDLCIRLLQKNIDALEYTGGVPFEVLRPVIERATPQQLIIFEEYNPYIMEDSDVVWQQHVQRHFRAEKRMEMESWREMFFRCQDDKDRKLSKLAENIKKSQKEIAAPVRKTQLAFVDSLVKPPRNVQRKQDQYGTKSKLIATPAARVAALSNVTPNAVKTGDVRLRVAASVRDHAHVSNSAIRAKKAPLMAKTLQLMRGRHKR